MPRKDGTGPPTGRDRKAGRMKGNQPAAGPGRKRCIRSKKRRTTRRTAPSVAS